MELDLYTYKYIYVHLKLNFHQIIYWYFCIIRMKRMCIILICIHIEKNKINNVR